MGLSAPEETRQFDVELLTTTACTSCMKLQHAIAVSWSSWSTAAKTISNADPASAGIRPHGSAPTDLFGVPGSASSHGRIRGGDEGGGENQGERNRRVGALWVVKPCEVSGRIRRDNRASRNKNAPHHSSLLLFVNGCSASRVAFSVGAFGRSCHALAVFRYDRPTRRMVLPASLPHFNGEGIGIYLFHGDGIPRCSSGRVLLAIVFVSAAVIDGSTVL